jgi:hypothetical protein
VIGIHGLKPYTVQHESAFRNREGSRVVGRRSSVVGPIRPSGCSAARAYFVILSGAPVGREAIERNAFRGGGEGSPSGGSDIGR